MMILAFKAVFIVVTGLGELQREKQSQDGFSQLHKPQRDNHIMTPSPYKPQLYA